MSWDGMSWSMSPRIWEMKHVPSVQRWPKQRAAYITVVYFLLLLPTAIPSSDSNLGHETPLPMYSGSGLHMRGRVPDVAQRSRTSISMPCNAVGDDDAANANASAHLHTLLLARVRVL